ncbi:hypothetical protein HK104_011349 [Borealophlyctis nickersoniae]|nr:hypothetical protein HK104_011349 [Borealophlyctis nickersoniae]
MEDLLRGILANNETDPGRLALALRIVEQFRAAKADEARALELEWKNKEAEARLREIELREKELEVEAMKSRAALSTSSTNVNAPPVVTVSELSSTRPMDIESPHMGLLSSTDSSNSSLNVANDFSAFPTTDAMRPPPSSQMPTYVDEAGNILWNDYQQAMLTLGLEDFGHAEMPRTPYFHNQYPPAQLQILYCHCPRFNHYPALDRPRNGLTAPRRPPNTTDCMLGIIQAVLLTIFMAPDPITPLGTLHQANDEKKSLWKKKPAVNRTLSAPYSVDVICADCEPDTAASAAAAAHGGPGGQGSSLVPGSKKRSTPKEPEAASCEVCKRLVGIGGIKLLDADKRGEIEPEFGVEVVCSVCRHKYALCTECGGGGKYRTGKWRPLGLFQPGRRTCNLPHVRIGSNPITFRVWTVPNGLAAYPAQRAAVLQDIDRAVPSMYYHRLAVPEVMELPPPNTLSTFEQLHERVTLRCNALRNTVLGPDVEAEHSLRKYFGGAWIERVSRHSKKDKDKSANEKSGGTSGTAGGAEPEDESDGGGPGEESLVMVGMSTIWWDRRGGVVWITAFQGLNTEYSTQGLMFRLCRKMLERVVADQQAEAEAAATAAANMRGSGPFEFNPQLPQPPPQIDMVGLPVFTEFASLAGVSHTLTRLGFLPLEEYERQHPELDRAVFERAVNDPEGVYGGKPTYRRNFFVANVRQLLAGPWGREGKSSREIRKIERDVNKLTVG